MTLALPAQLQHPDFRFVPLYRGSKASMVSKEPWQAGSPYSADMDLFLASEGDLGIRLDKSVLVVVDLDSVLEYVFSGNEAHTRIAYGGAELWDWLRSRDLDLPRTFTVTTPGRSDGSHVTGLHMYYRQSPAWHVKTDKAPVAHAQIKVTGIARFTDRSAVVDDVGLASFPEAVARALEPVPTSFRRSSDGEYAQGGVNNALTAIKGLLMGSFWPQDAADEIVRHANQLLDDPLDAGRLERTVLRPKDWYGR
jgi:hypothetical protein